MVHSVRSCGLSVNPAKIRLVPANEWGTVARACPQYNYQQSPAYGLEMAKRRRASCEFVVVTDAGNRILGAASVRVRTVPFAGGGIAFIGGGPLLSRGLNGSSDCAGFRVLIDAVVAEYVSRRRLCLRASLPLADATSSQQVGGVFADAGFRRVSKRASYRTLLVDLSRSTDQIRAGLNKKWRNQLSAASRGNVSVELSREANAMARLAPLLEETQNRKGFTTELGASFYDRVQQQARNDDRMLVAIAVEDGKDVAGVAVSVLANTAVYVLGATTIDGMRSKAAYVLHWRVMEIARQAGCQWYDLGGIDPKGNPGVYHFKSGFGGSDVVMPGPFEIYPSGFAGLISRAVETSYTALKRLRS